MSPKNKGTPTSPRLVLKVFIAAIITLAACEGLCRSMFKKNIEELKFGRSDLYYYYDRAGYRHNMPNSVGYERMWNDQGRAEFRINSFGFRGPEIPAEKPSGTTRIFFLGDSITLGGRLPEDATFVSRIGKALGAASSTRYEVINSGVGDVGLFEEEDTLKTQGIKVQPDVVVLCWYLNDARPPVGFPEEVVYDNLLIRWFNAHPIFEKSSLAGFVYDSLRRSLVAQHLYRDRRFEWTQAYMTGKWASDPAEFASVIGQARYDWGDAWNDKSMKWMEERIRGLKEFSSAKGIRFVVVAMPEHAQVYARFRSPIVDWPQNDLAAYAEKNGIQVLNLLPLLRAESKEPLFYDNCHYTPHGNEVVARHILDFLRRSGAVASR
ncbi:MAG: SGNH/GDSL hydrolase family protein [Elusimicrobiota bacterium]